MLSLTVILFVISVSEPGTNYPRPRFVFLLLRYNHEKKFEKKYYEKHQIDGSAGRQNHATLFIEGQCPPCSLQVRAWG